MLERTLKEWIQPEMTREFLPQQSHEMWSEEARNTHISNTLRAVDDQRPIFQQYSSIQQWSFITWWFGVEPCSPSKGSFHNPRCQDTRRSLAAPSGDKAWGHGFESLTLCGWAYLRRGRRSMVRHFIPAAWVTFQVRHGGTENQVLIRWRSWEKRWTMMGNGRTSWLNISNMCFSWRPSKFSMNRSFWFKSGVSTIYHSETSHTACSMDLAWILPAHAAEMGAPSPQNMPSEISSAPKQG